MKKEMIFDVSYKTLIDAKPLRIIFDKTDGFIRGKNGDKLYLFGFFRLYTLSKIY